VIPAFDENGNLPPGIHVATITEVETRFANNNYRKRLFQGLLRVLEILRDCNCPEVHLNGSYITTKSEPGDYDLCYEPAGMKATEEFKQFLLTRETRKAEHLGDIFPRMPQPPYEMDHVEDWQTDRDRDGEVKGIVRIILRHTANDQE
jgi:hypothetical protein